MADREQQLRSARISVALLSDEIKSLVDASAQAQLQHAAELEKTTNRLESQVPIFLNREAVCPLFSPFCLICVPLQWQAQFLDAAVRHQQEVHALKFQVLSLQDKLAAEVEEKQQLASALDSANTQLAAQKSYEALLTNIGQALRPVGSPRAAAAELGQAPSP